MYIMSTISYISIPTNSKTIYIDLFTGEILNNEKVVYNFLDQESNQSKKSNSILSQFLRYFTKV